MKNITYFFLATLLVSGCSFQNPTRVENDFGVSVRTMVAAQIYDPEAAAEPAILGPETLGGDAAQISVDRYLELYREGKITKIGVQ